VLGRRSGVCWRGLVCGGPSACNRFDPWLCGDRFKTMTRRLFFSFAFLLGTAMTSHANSLADFTLTGIDGKPMPLAQFKGQVVLVVNTASECGYTGQYEGLEALYQAYKDKGLVIIGVPSNEFGGQEPGKAAEIATFCKLNFGVTFPLADKTVVKGSGAHPLYQWAGTQAGVVGSPKWNFHKYLFARNGRFVDWFSTPTEPMSGKLKAAVEKALAE
jgi:glutathione peroxidase